MWSKIVSPQPLVKCMSSLPPDKTRHELRRLRYRAGFTQAELAQAVGLSRQGYWAIENRGVMPKPKTGTAIAKALKAKPEDFLEELAA